MMKPSLAWIELDGFDLRGLDKTVKRRYEMTGHIETTPTGLSKAAMNKRMETIAWGFFLIMLGGFMYIPDTTLSKGFWSIGVGLIMLGLNLMRYVYKIRMSGFTTVLGIISLVAGTLQLMGFMALEGAVLLIILGAYLVLKHWFDEKKVFGKAEES